MFAAAARDTCYSRGAMIRIDGELRPMHIRLFALILLGAAALAAGATWAQPPQYPAKAIRLIVPYPAGGPASIVAHSVGQKLGDALGQPVIVDNRPGAGANLGTDMVAKAAPAGH